MPYIINNTATAVRRALIIAAPVVLALAGCRAVQSREQALLPHRYHHHVDFFAIHSNVPIDDEHPVASELVQLRIAVQALLGLPDQGQLIDIYIFDDRAQFERFIETTYPGLPRRRAFFMARGQQSAVYAFRDQKLLEDLRHEACHALVHSAFGTLPLWLDEGLAEYFELPDSAGRVHSRHVIELNKSIEQGWRPSLTRLEALTELQQMTAADYREAWGWVYWLLHASPDSRQLLLDYLEEIRAGRSDPMSSRIFPRLPRPDGSYAALMTSLQRQTQP
jgi:hypothetical protein